MFKKLLKVTATKRSIIISLCFGILAILVLSYFFKLAFELYLNPTYNLGYIYIHMGMVYMPKIFQLF